MEPVFVLKCEYGITAEFYETKFTLKKSGVFNLGLKSEETVNYEKMESLEFTKGFLGVGSIVIDTIVEKYDLYFHKEETETAIQVRDFLEDILKGEKKIQDQPDITDQLKKLKDLLDIDAITEEEFNSSKEKLLKKL